MFKFVFAFHIFLLENSFINRVDSQFVFDTLIECRTAEMLIQKREDPNNCIKKYTNQANNNSLDNLNMIMKSYNKSEGDKSWKCLFSISAFFMIQIVGISVTNSFVYKTEEDCRFVEKTGWLMNLIVNLNIQNILKWWRYWNGIAKRFGFKISKRKCQTQAGTKIINLFLF